MNSEYVSSDLHKKISYSSNLFTPLNRGINLTRSIQTIPPQMQQIEYSDKYLRQSYPYPSSHLNYSLIPPNLRYSQPPLISTNSTLRGDNLFTHSEQKFNNKYHSLQNNANYRYGENGMTTKGYSSQNLQSSERLNQKDNLLYRSWSPLFEKEKKQGMLIQTPFKQSQNINYQSLQQNQQHDTNFTKYVSNDTQQILQKWNNSNQFGVTPHQNIKFYQQIRKSKESNLQNSPIIAEPFETISSIDSSNQQIQQNQLQTLNDQVQQFQYYPLNNNQNEYIQNTNGGSNMIQTPTNQNPINSQSSKQTEFRVGIGYDVHRLVDNRELVIGGVKLKHDKGLDGHSDADVLIHSVIDALLGACKYGDIGKMFPGTPEFKGISSLELLRRVRELMNRDNIKVINIDTIIIAEAPKMAAQTQNMEKNIAETLDVEVDRVSVKATTEDKLGFTGSKQGIASKAICIIEKPFNYQRQGQLTQISKQNDQKEEQKNNQSKEIYISENEFNKMDTSKQITQRNQKEQQLEYKKSSSTSTREKNYKKETINDKKVSSKDAIKNGAIKLQNLKNLNPKKVYVAVAVLLIIILLYLLLIK